MMMMMMMMTTTMMIMAMMIMTKMTGLAGAGFEVIKIGERC